MAVPEVEKGPTVSPPYGALFPQIQSKDFTSYERMFRKLPEAGMFLPDVSVKNPFQFEVGGLNVPQQSWLVLTFFSLAAGKFSGVAAGDTEPLEPERMTTCWGFDLVVAQNSRPRNCEYEIDPVPILSNGQSYDRIQTDVGRGTVVDTAFQRTRAAAFAAPSGAGRATLPFRYGKYGSPQGPFTIVLAPGQTLAMRCTIFRPLPIPIAYVQFDVSGYQIPQTLAAQLGRSINGA